MQNHFDDQFSGITEDRYADLLEVVPPIFVSSEYLKPHNSGAKVTGIFAVSEPYSHRRSVICNVCWKETVEAETHCYSRLMEIYTPANVAIIETYSHYYGRNYIAKPVK